MKPLALLGVLAVIAVAAVLIVPAISAVDKDGDGSVGNRHWVTGEEIRLVAVGGLVDVAGGKSLQFRFYYQTEGMDPLRDEALMVVGESGNGQPRMAYRIYHDSVDAANLIVQGTPVCDHFVDWPLYVACTNGVVDVAHAENAVHDHYIVTLETSPDLWGAESLSLTVDVRA